MSIKEKVAYLKGLAEGLGLDSDTKEGKLMLVIIDTLSDMAEEIDDLGENALDLGEELDALSSDLADIEELLFEDEDDDDDDDFFGFGDEDDDECGCGFCGSDDFAYVIECSACGTDIELDDDILAGGSVVCSSCGNVLEFEFEDEDDDDDDDDDDDNDDEDDE